METIDQESVRFMNQITDLDNFRSKYREVNVDDNFSVIYPAMEIFSLEKNMYILLAESNKVSFKPSWSYRPDYASYDLYGSVVYWPILLYVNNILNFEEFISLDEILVPYPKTILKLVQDKVSEDYIEEVGIKEDPTGFDIFYKMPFDEDELNKLKAKENIYDTSSNISSIATDSTTELVEKVDIFTLTSLDIINQYVDLSYEPINKSNISVYLEEFNIDQKYGYDYILKNNDEQELKRISWKPSDCFGNMGLSFMLSVGMKIRIVYLYERTLY